jgi:hypothetical protein
MPITPDTKDWTWVIERVCPECGFDTSSFPREQVGSMIRDNSARWKDVLSHPEVATRPSEDRWSALEYACHVRDVFDLYDFRLKLMLEEDGPSYPNWDQDRAAVDGNYGSEDPTEVHAVMEEAAGRLADRFDSVSGAQWERTGFRSDGARFTIETFARYLIHDPVHHLHDVEQGFEKLSRGS